MALDGATATNVVKMPASARDIAARGFYYFKLS
jgi:hypothetical protein